MELLVLYIEWIGSYLFALSVACLNVLHNLAKNSLKSLWIKVLTPSWITLNPA